MFPIAAASSSSGFNPCETFPEKRDQPEEPAQQLRLYTVIEKDACRNRAREQSPSSRSRTHWTDSEHEAFINALTMHGRNWEKVAELVGTKTLTQVRSHGQKYFIRSNFAPHPTVRHHDGFAVPPARPKKTTKISSQPTPPSSMTMAQLSGALNGAFSGINPPKYEFPPYHGSGAVTPPTPMWGGSPVLQATPTPWTTSPLFNPIDKAPLTNSSTGFRLSAPAMASSTAPRYHRFVDEKVELPLSLCLDLTLEPTVEVIERKMKTFSRCDSDSRDVISALLMLAESEPSTMKNEPTLLTMWHTAQLHNETIWLCGWEPTLSIVEAIINGDANSPIVDLQWSERHDALGLVFKNVAEAGLNFPMWQPQFDFVGDSYSVAAASAAAIVLGAVFGMKSSFIRRQQRAQAPAPQSFEHRDKRARTTAQV